MTEEDLKRLNCEKKVDSVIDGMRKLGEIVNVDTISTFASMMRAVDSSKVWSQDDKNQILAEQYLVQKKIYCKYGCENSNCEFYGGIRV